MDEEAMEHGRGWEEHHQREALASTERRRKLEALVGDTGREIAFLREGRRRLRAGETPLWLAGPAQRELLWLGWQRLLDFSRVNGYFECDCALGGVEEPGDPGYRAEDHAAGCASRAYASFAELGAMLAAQLREGTGKETDADVDQERR